MSYDFPEGTPRPGPQTPYEEALTDAVCIPHLVYQPEAEALKRIAQQVKRDLVIARTDRGDEGLLAAGRINELMDALAGEP